MFDLDQLLEEPYPTARVGKVEELDAPSHFCATACTLESINDFISTMRRQRLAVASTLCITLRPWGVRPQICKDQPNSFEVEYGA